MCRGEDAARSFLQILASVHTPSHLPTSTPADEVRIYHDRHLSWTHTVSSPITGMCFGRYGREDNTLILVTKSGALEIKV